MIQQPKDQIVMYGDDTNWELYLGCGCIFAVIGMLATGYWITQLIIWIL